jgi:hypothetical protein
MKGRISTSLIPKADNVIEHRYEDGDTWDIIKVILEGDKKLGNHLQEFASQFEKSYSGLYDIWYWVRNNIKYVADKKIFDKKSGNWIQHEKVKDPRVTWQDGYGDCKSISLFIASLLRGLGVKYRYRFASYYDATDKSRSHDKAPTHVYVVATLNDRDVILDAVHNKFDEEVDYHKKWERMQTRISYLHGPSNGTKAGSYNVVKSRPTRAQRIADAPRQSITLPTLQIGNKTEGELTLELLERQIRILMAHYGDSDDILQKALNIIYQSKLGHFHYNYTLPTGYVDPRLNDLIRQIQKASKNTRISGTPYHIGDLEYKRPPSYPQNCDEMRNSAEYKSLVKERNQLFLTQHGDGFKNKGRSLTSEESKRLKEIIKWFSDFDKDFNNCGLTKQFGDVLTKYIDKSAHHMLYEFEKDPNSKPNTVGTKTVLHKVGISAMSDLAYIDRNNVHIMAENGIMTTNSTIKNISDITPEATIQYTKEALSINDPAARLGDPLITTGVIIAIIGLFGKAIDAAAQHQQKMNDESRINFQSRVNGYGTAGYSPDPLDWDSGEATGGGNSKDKQSSLTKYLPYALLGGAALLFIPSMLKK